MNVRIINILNSIMLKCTSCCNVLSITDYGSTDIKITIINILYRRRTKSFLGSCTILFKVSCKNFSTKFKTHVHNIVVSKEKEKKEIHFSN